MARRRRADPLGQQARAGVMGQPVGPESKEMFSAIVCRLLRESRHRLGLTQAQVAARTGGTVTKAALANYETGHRSLRVDVLWVIALALGEDLGALLARAERAVGLGADSGASLTVSVEALLTAKDRRLDPVQRWMRLQGDGREVGVVTLDPSAIGALAQLMGVTAAQCRAILAAAVEQPAAQHPQLPEQRGPQEGVPADRRQPD